MDGTTEKDCSPLWSLYQQIVSDMKNHAPMWEEFISKATKLHSALKSALVAIAAFLDAFQKIADAATNARGATKEIGTALTRVCLRHRAIETRMKTFISALMDTLITPLSERAEEWRRGTCGPGALSREHARECKRARAELRRRVHEAQRHARKARRAPPDAKRKADVNMQDIQERKQQLEEMEEKAVKAALVEERSRFCHFVSLLNPVVESEVAMLAEVGHLQEGTEQLTRHIAEPRTLPPASLQVICDLKSSTSVWAEAGCGSSPCGSRLGSRKSSLTSLASITSGTSDQHLVSSSIASVSPAVSATSSGGATPAPEEPLLSQSAARLSSVCSADSGFRSQDALLRRSLYAENGSDNQSVSSECTMGATVDDSDEANRDSLANASSATWPDLKDTAQFERAASAIMGGRPHTISAAYERGHPRAALSVHTFSNEAESDVTTPSNNREGIYSRPPLPTRGSSLERPAVPARGGVSGVSGVSASVSVSASAAPAGGANTPSHEFKPAKPSSLPPHLTKEMPQAVYVNMSELASLAASRAQHHHTTDHPHQEKVCSESSASESSLESSSGYGSQGAFAQDEHAALIALQHVEVVESEIVAVRCVDPLASARDSLSVSLGSLEEAVRSLQEVTEEAPFATVSKKPAVPKRRPLSMTATVYSRRGSSSSVGKPPPPVRRSSSISRPQRPPYAQASPQSPQVPSDTDNLPPPPAFLLQPDNETNAGGGSVCVAATIQQLTMLRHTPASPLAHHARNHANHAHAAHATHAHHDNGRTDSTGNLNPIYGLCLRKNTFNNSTGDIYRDGNPGTPLDCQSPAGSSPSTPSYGETASLSSFGPRVSNDSSHYGQTGFKLQQEKKYTGIYASPAQLAGGGGGGGAALRREPASPLALRRNIAARSHSADRHHVEAGGLIATLSAKLAPQLSPRASRRVLSSITAADPPTKGKGTLPSAVEPAFLNKLSATIQQQRRQLDSTRATTVRDMINAHAQADPRVCHTSLMEQIKRGATLRRNKHCNDRSAPKIR